MTKQERLAWLTERKSGIGASDMYSICGVSPWGTALGVYLSKVGPVDKRAASMDDAQYAGTLMEPVIAKMYVDRTGKTLKKAPAITRHEKIGWMYASLDYINEDGEPVDCKNTSKSEGWGEEGTDQVPFHYAIQLHHQMEVTGAKQAHLAVLFFGNQLKVYTVKRDHEIAMQLIQIGHDFWKLVQNGTPPEPDWEHPSTPNVIKKLYSRVESRTVQLGEAELDMLKRYYDLSDAAKAAQKEADALESRLIVAIGNADLAEFPEPGWKITRKEESRRETIVPAYKFINFRKYRPKAKKAATVKAPKPVKEPKDFAESEEKEVENHE